MLENDEAHVWWVETDANAGDGSEWVWLLSATERARLNRLSEATDRRDYAAAHALLRTTLSMYGSVAPQSWEFTDDEFGKPHICKTPGAERLQFNLSHTRGLVACAVAQSLRVGIDVESLDRVPATDRLYERCLSESERSELAACSPEAVQGRFVELWTLKEAVLKALGVGLHVEPAAISFAWDGNKLPVLERRPPELRDIDFSLTLYQPTPRHRLALAVERDRDRPIAICVRAASNGHEITGPSAASGDAKPGDSAG